MPVWRGVWRDLMSDIHYCEGVWGKRFMHNPNFGFSIIYSFYLHNISIIID